MTAFERAAPDIVGVVAFLHSDISRLDSAGFGDVGISMSFVSACRMPGRQAIATYHRDNGSRLLPAWR